MAPKHDAIIRWNRCRGRNGFDPPDTLPDDMAAEALNVVFVQAGLARKRYGYSVITSATLSSIFAAGGAFWLMPFYPGQTVTGAYLIVAMGNGEFATITTGATEQLLTEANVNDGDDWAVTGVTLNGKAYIAYNSDENRLHVFHPAISTTVLRRSGLETPAAPTVANQGGGATYAAIIRRYRIQWRTLVGGAKQRASLLGASVAFTPSGAGDAARVTQPAPPGEGETHWVVYGTASATDDNASWFELSTEIAIATTFYDDSAAPSTYDDNDPAPAEGAFTPWPSVKYLATDGQRLLGFGVWETSQGDAMEPLPGRVYISPVLDTSDYDDDERVSNTVEIKGTIDIGRNVGVVDRGIAGPINGEFIVGQSRGLTLLSPTGDAVDPYVQRKLSNTVGFVSHASAFVGEDEVGNPCIYFLDPMRGPYRYGANGLEWVGYDVQDVWAKVDQGGGTPAVLHGVWYEPLKAALWFVPILENSTQFQRVLFYQATLARRDERGVLHYGWSVWSRPTSDNLAYHSTIFGSDIVTTNDRSTIWTAHGGDGEVLGAMAQIPRYGASVSGVTDDGGANFTGSITSRAFKPFEPARCELQGSYLDANTVALTLRQTLTRNYGDESVRTSDVDMTAVGSETRALRKFENSALTDADAFQVTLSDLTTDGAWTIHEWVGYVKKNQEK